MSRSYHVILEPEQGGGYSVHVPALPGCHTQGDTQDEALANAREAIEGHIESLIANDLEVPAPDGNHFSVEVDDDEPIGPETRASLDEERAKIAAGELGLTTEELRAELGLSR